MKRLIKAIVLAAALAGAAAGEAAATPRNLVKNGTFKTREGWAGGAFDKGPGRVVLDQGVGRLEKDRGPGATQLLQICEIGKARRLRLTFRYRGQGLGVAYKFVTPSKTKPGEFDAVKNDAGGDLSDFLPFKADANLGSQEWGTFDHEFAVPQKARKAKDACLRLQFSVWGANEPRAAEVDDVSLVEVEEKVVEKPKENLTFRVERLKKKIPYGPIAPVAPVKAEIRDGILLKDGRPGYWIGNGCTLGSEQAGPMGMWLSKLQGTTALSFPSDFAWSCALKGNEIVFSGEKSLVTPFISQYREGERLGFLCDFFANSDFYGSGLRKMAEAHPQFLEFHNDYGHYMGFDAGNPVGRELQIGRRQGFFQYVDGVSKGAGGMAVLELSREPGPNPKNERVKKGFREWAKRKYRTLDAANRVWKTDFESWDDVLPHHLRETDVTGYMARLLYYRQMRRDHKEMVWDWAAYMQDDSTDRIRDAFEDIRRELPDMTTTIDVRGHNMEMPSYGLIDPERVAPLEDLFYLHFGWHSYVYNDEPYDRATVLSQANFPLFSYSFFRTNTKKPLIDSEDIVTVASAPKSDGESMKRNDIGQLHATPWKFRLETKPGEGTDGEWFRPGLDDSKWDELAIGTCWDETDKFKAKPGVGWYRKKFVARANRLDWEDGSHQFFIYGKGVAQKGTVWLNGHKVGDVSGWDARYRFDVGALLNFGGENEIVWRVDGSGFQNGLRFYCHVLPNDKISRSVPFGAKQYRHMLWTFLMHGASGCWVWPEHEDKLRAHLPGLARKLDSAADVALADLRTKRGAVAYLYGYLSNLGLPCTIGETHGRYLDWMCAFEFLGLRTDVFGEQTFCREVTPDKYPFLVVPYTAMVRDETYARVRDYVKNGGTLVLTEDSLTKTFKAYADTDVRRFAGPLPKDGEKYSVVTRGRGRVVTVRGEPAMEDVMRLVFDWRKRFGDAIPKAEVVVVSKNRDRREIPLIQRELAGDETRKLLYLANWGGIDHRVKVTLPESVAGWRIVAQYEGEATLTGERTLEAVVPSQDVVALVLAKDGAKPVKSFAVSPARAKAMEHFVALNEAKAQPGQRRVLWPYYVANRSQNKEMYVYEMDRIAAFGGVSEQRPLKEWTPELLAQYDLVVIPETETFHVLRDKAFMDRLGRMLDEYVRNGGSLFMDVHTPWTINVYGNTLSGGCGLAPWLGVALAGGCYDEARAVFGDPYQVWTDNLAADDVLAQGVGRYELYHARTLAVRPSEKANPQAVIRLAGRGAADDAKGGVVLTREERGKGRIVVNVSAMSFQPFRIEKSGNAALLENIVGWLFREDVTDAMRRDFKDNLFLTEETLRTIAAEDAR